MICRNCGGELRPGAKFCGKCGMAVGGKKKKAQKGKAGLAAIALTLLVIAAVAFLAEFKHGFVSSFVRRKEIEQSAMKIVEYISVGDAEKALSLIYPESAALDFEQEEQLPQLQTMDDSLLISILKHTDIELEKLSLINKTASYRIAAPDLKTFLQEYAESDGSCNMMQYLQLYISRGASSHEESIAVAYTLAESVDLDYSSFEFMDALYGGMLSSFNDMYYETAKGLLEGVKNYEDN